MNPNPLCDMTRPWGIIKLIHPTDKKIHTFRSEINSLTGDRLSGWDHNAPYINDSLSDISTMMKNIFIKGEVLEYNGPLAEKGRNLASKVKKI